MTMADWVATQTRLCLVILCFWAYVGDAVSQEIFFSF